MTSSRDIDIQNLRWLFPPRLRKTLKYIYQGFYVSAGRLMDQTSRLQFPCPYQLIGEKSSHCFFGYYDKSPWDSSERYLAFHRTPSTHTNPPDELEIRVHDLESHHNQVLATTRAWNWQQGAMLRWLPNVPAPTLVYNTFHDGYYQSECRNLDGECTASWPLPVYDLSQDGHQALSLDFSRLTFAAPGYGYHAVPFDKSSDLHPDSDGIWYFHPDADPSRLIISLDQLANIGPRDDFHTSFHYVNHLMFSPSGCRFVFLHRWFRDTPKTSQTFTRMWVANSDGSNLDLVNDYDMSSHYTWLDDEHILAFCRHPSHGDRYYLIDVQSHDHQLVGSNCLFRDGHPTYSTDRNWILTDTYPDKHRLRSLLLFHIPSESLQLIGKAYAPFRYDAEFRCDLHPRWSPSNCWVCADTAHNGCREILVLSVGEILDA